MAQDEINIERNMVFELDHMLGWLLLVSALLGEVAV